MESAPTAGVVVFVARLESAPTAGVRLPRGCAYRGGAPTVGVPIGVLRRR